MQDAALVNHVLKDNNVRHKVVVLDGFLLLFGVFVGNNAFVALIDLVDFALRDGIRITGRFERTQRAGMHQLKRENFALCVFCEINF